MINICATENLLNTLKIQNIDVQDYVPAYNGESAGLDLFNVSSQDITIYPSSFKSVTNIDIDQRTLIPTGLRIHVPKGYVALVQERGSITKTPLKVRAGVIDCGFTGEIFVNCVNTGSEAYTIKNNSKLPFQIVVVKCDNHFNVISEKEYLNLSNSSIRKEGQVGSSD